MNFRRAHKSGRSPNGALTRGPPDNNLAQLVADSKSAALLLECASFD